MNLQELYKLSEQHSYYCNDSNFYSNDCFYEFDNLKLFLDEWDDADLDYNMLFRWDLKISDDRKYYLQLYFMQQRKGIFLINSINNVTDDDVPAILEYLKTRKDYLFKLWNI